MLKSTKNRQPHANLMPHANSNFRKCKVPCLFNAPQVFDTLGYVLVFPTLNYLCFQEETKAILKAAKHYTTNQKSLFFVVNFG